MLDALPAADDPDSVEFDREVRRALFHRAASKCGAKSSRQTWEAFWETGRRGNVGGRRRGETRHDGRGGPGRQVPRAGPGAEPPWRNGRKQNDDSMFG